MDPLRVLTWHVHGSYLEALAHAGHELIVPTKPGRPEGYGGRPRGRGPASSVVEVPAEAVRGLRFDVVLCDMTMPGMRGDELYFAVKARAPAIADRFVFMTGGLTEAKSQAFLDEVPNERIDKPFNVQNLRGIARRFVAASTGT